MSDVNPPLTIDSLSETPQYSIKVVCAQTGLRAVTLRAWERRYQLLTPQRTAGNYRLYSERDVALLRWLKARVDTGQPISRAAAELAALRHTGVWPELLPTVPQPRPMVSTVAPEVYAKRLYKSLVAMDEMAARAVLSEAQTSFSLEVLCANLLGPCLYEIGEAWASGNIRIATEHFASNFVRGQLITLFQALPAPRTAPRVVVGCAPGEMHDIGPLMLALLLRQAGYRVEYLGADLHLGDLVEYARAERPALICLSATDPEPARRLASLHSALTRLRPRPKFGYGGAAFNYSPELRDEVPGVFLGTSFTEACTTVRQLLAS